MTSQIAVFNLTGVAVASDSVTTVTRRGEARAFTGAQKVFDLGPDHRAVAMTCGEARFMDVPYSVLVPQWRATITEPLPRIEDYAESFAAWLPTRTDLFDAERQQGFFAWLVRDYYLYVRRSIVSRSIPGNKCCPTAGGLVVDHARAQHANPCRHSLNYGRNVKGRE